MKKYVKLLRIKHYVKNMLCVLPLFFSGHLLDKSLLTKTIVGTLLFCILSSIVYIFNDIADIEKDQKHPTKCNRPIASGAISIKKAWIIEIVLSAILILHIFLTGMGVDIWGWLMLYLFINIFYSRIGKSIPILDVFLLAAGYPIRIFYGGALVDIKISSWLFLTVTCIALYLGFGKRYGELLRNNEFNLLEVRPVLQKYSIDYLTAQMYLCLGGGMVFYSLWAIERKQQLVYTVPIVIAICMKYNLLVNEQRDGDPVELVLSSKSMLLLICIFLLALGNALYM